MTNDKLETSFPNTRKDVADLQKTAVEAAKDLQSTATVHAQKAQGQLKDLASHAREEGGDQVEQARAVVADLGTQVRDYVTARPLACIGAALALGLVIGLTRRSCNQAA